MARKKEQLNTKLGHGGYLEVTWTIILFCLQVDMSVWIRPQLWQTTSDIAVSMTSIEKQDNKTKVQEQQISACQRWAATLSLANAQWPPIPESVETAIVEEAAIEINELSFRFLLVPMSFFFFCWVCMSMTRRHWLSLIVMYKLVPSKFTPTQCKSYNIWLIHSV